MNRIDKAFTEIENNFRKVAEQNKDRYKDRFDYELETINKLKDTLENNNKFNEDFKKTLGITQENLKLIAENVNLHDYDSLDNNAINAIEDNNKNKIVKNTDINTNNNNNITSQQMVNRLLEKHNIPIAPEILTKIFKTAGRHNNNPAYIHI